MLQQNPPPEIKSSKQSEQQSLSQSPPSESPPKQKNKNKFLKILLLVIILIIVIAGITIFLFYKLKAKPEAPKKAAYEYVIKKDWQVYEDDWLILQYPNDWKILLDEGNIYGFQIDNNTMPFEFYRLEKDEDYVDLDQHLAEGERILKETEGEKYIPRETVRFKFGGDQIARITNKVSENYTEHTLVIDHNDYLWTVIYPISATKESLKWQNDVGNEIFDTLDEIFQTLILK